MVQVSSFESIVKALNGAGVRLTTLVKMKLEANRPKDREDIENLKLIYGEDFQS